MATINLPTLAHTVTMNGSTLTASSAGNIALGSAATSVTSNGVTYSVDTNGGIYLSVGGNTVSGGLPYVYNGASGGSPPAIYFLIINACPSLTVIVERLNQSFPSAAVNSCAITVDAVSCSGRKRIYGAYKSSSGWVPLYANDP